MLVRSLEKTKKKSLKALLISGKDLGCTRCSYTPPKSPWKNIKLHRINSRATLLLRTLNSIKKGGKKNDISPGNNNVWKRDKCRLTLQAHGGGG